MEPVMKKRILIAGLAVTLVIVNANVAVFAETKPMESKYMSVQELKSAIAEKELDGVLSEAEQKSIFDNATEEAGQEKSLIMPTATSGTSSVWKEYGDRYFTAKATVNYGSAAIVLSLENHYTISSTGITERYGKANRDLQSKVLIAVGTPKITKSSATAVGNSVSLNCAYSCNAVGVAPAEYVLNTSVKYLKLDKTAKKMQVQQAWNLTKK